MAAVELVYGGWVADSLMERKRGGLPTRNIRPIIFQMPTRRRNGTGSLFKPGQYRCRRVMFLGPVLCCSCFSGVGGVGWNRIQGV